MKRNLHFSLGLVLLMVLSGFTVLAQVKLSGKVTDENNQPLPGVIVQQLNTQNKTATDVNGAYVITLEAAGGKALVFSYVGYTPVTVPYTGNAVLNAGMKPSASDLDEVVVVGYTSQKKSSLTGAIGTVNMAEADKRRVPDVAQVLQGQVAGVQVTQSTGAPGDPINIRIRGEGTIGNNSPLFIVDGVPSKDISFLNPSDIKSMTVLKDASAAAIYGSRASAGVVVITTNQGVAGKSRIDFNYFNGIQKATNLPQMLNATQYLNKQEEAWVNAGNTGTNPYTTAKSRTNLANTDWLNELFENGHSQGGQLSVSGGSEKVQYLLAGGFYKQNGIVVYNNDEYKRINFRANINANVTDRFKLGTNFQISNESQDALSSKGDAPGIIRHAFLRPPVLGVYKDPSDPTWSADDPFTDLPFYLNNNQVTGWDKNFELSQNPIALAYFSNDKRNSFRTFGNVYGEYALLADQSLKFRTNLGVDLMFRHNKQFLKNFGDDDGQGAKDDSGNFIDPGAGRQNRPNGLNEERGQQTNFTWNNTLAYDKTINQHQVSALIGSEYISNKSDAISASRRRYDYTMDTFQYIDFGGTSRDLYNGGSGAESSLFSLFGSATYSYGNRYFVTGNLRADASSRFGENHKWGYFPSVSVGWKISQENFMKNAEWISDLKLRASYGQLGNQEIGDYTYLTLIRKDGEEYKTDRYGNPDLKWETTTQTNIGLDLGLIKNSLYLSADYFHKVTSGILLPLQLPSLVGDVKPTNVNAGEVQNKGFELGLTYTNQQHEFKYSINGNIATLKNKVTKLHPNLSLLGSLQSPFRTVVGESLNSFYGYKMIGIYQNAAEVASYLHGTPGYTEKPGDIKFADLDGNGVINDNDKQFIGSNIPDLTYGLTFSGSYKGFDLSVLLQGVEGIDKYNQLKQIIDYDSRPFNHTTAVLQSWHGEGTSNTVPRLTLGKNGGDKVSSVFVENASYFRVKNIELGYSFGPIVKKMNIGVQNIRLYVSGQNLYTRTKYSGLDPETVDAQDFGTYPQSKAFLFGVNVNF
ncbi:TonB-linked SusC/RagA family outer membrane protein [Pedobacter africanus]|uniref:TonB-linked SusC/RagA family outer membrane protein n=1 Tax=Pedobacter africanus TaxID=151894 RepID=A0ACC6L2K7_9SPHI|nr:TonB-dependent receptor [Pedobacter africanus]MDR6785742.1 TonB-linked SusC/RagA family outer membrane protein [Pedobacter africanus]